MEQIVEYLGTLPDQVIPIGIGIAVVCMVAAGIMMMTGTENASKAKKWIMYICIGVAVMLFAVSFIASLQTGLTAE